jgi:PIN domain nuclease of toxin-antitoxin system
MADEYIVDAHSLIWFLEGSQRLGMNARTAMRDPGSTLVLPVIALAEACWMVERGRSIIPSVAALLADVDADPRITLVPLDRDILDISLTLTAIGEMHDRQIVATALLRARYARRQHYFIGPRPDHLVVAG